MRDGSLLELADGVKLCSGAWKRGQDNHTAVFSLYRLTYDMRPELLAPTDPKIKVKYGKMNKLFLHDVTCHYLNLKILQFVWSYIWWLYVWGYVHGYIIDKHMKTKSYWDGVDMIYYL